MPQRKRADPLLKLHFILSTSTVPLTNAHRPSSHDRMDALQLSINGEAPKAAYLAGPDLTLTNNSCAPTGTPPERVSFDSPRLDDTLHSLASVPGWLPFLPRSQRAAHFTWTQNWLKTAIILIPLLQYSRFLCRSSSNKKPVSASFLATSPLKSREDPFMLVDLFDFSFLPHSLYASAEG